MIIMETTIVMIMMRTMKIGNDCKTIQMEKKQTKQ